MNDTQLNELAMTITNRLMTNGFGDVGTRLANKKYAPKDTMRDTFQEVDLGGMCKATVYQQVVAALTEARAADARVSARLEQAGR